MARTRKAKTGKVTFRTVEPKEEKVNVDIFDDEDEEDEEEEDEDEEDEEEDDEEEDDEEDEVESESDDEEDTEEEDEQEEDDEKEPDEELKTTVKRRGRKKGSKTKVRKTTTKRSANDEEFFANTLNYLTYLCAYLYTMRQIVESLKLEKRDDSERVKNYAFKNLLKFEDKKLELEAYLSDSRSSVYKTVVEQSFNEMKQEYSDIRKELHEL